jgi:protein-S-isoprenylcysteine O-methyltransferase Ste14
MGLAWQAEPGVLNGWLLIVPLLVPSLLLAMVRPATARRMADMSGYSQRERVATVVASIAPYPFFVATIWTPLVITGLTLPVGLGLFGLGLVLFYWAIASFSAAPPEMLIERGPYRWSRNPIYVANAVACAGICVATRHGVLTAWLLLMLLPQHLMIRAEERRCADRFGKAYLDYQRRVPRYLLVR